MKKYLIKNNIILTGFSLIIILVIIATFIILRSDYSFELKINNEKLEFFDEETLYFNKSVDIDFNGSGYSTKIDDDSFKDNIVIIEDGTYDLCINKLLKNYDVTIKIDSNPDIYLIDEEDNIIHNYLSNNSSFKIVRSSEKINVYVNNMAYIDGTLITENDNYTITTDDNTYTVNILDIDK